jgi:hypothetical protein
MPSIVVLERITDAFASTATHAVIRFLSTPTCVVRGLKMSLVTQRRLICLDDRCPLAGDCPEL